MDFDLERFFLARGCRMIAGVDEAGRGPLAGPVVAAAVVFPVEWILNGLPSELAGVRDSKRLTASRRAQLYDVLVNHPSVCHAYAVVDSAEIDRINILQATHLAMQKAVANLPVVPDHVLVDGLSVSGLLQPHTPLVGGDAKSFSIAAASIIAKVVRDRLMSEFHARWPQYGFDKHKGYGTPAHLRALALFGPCPIHRKSFRPVRECCQQRQLF